MRVQVNGQTRDLPDAMSLSQLLDYLHVKRDGTAVELNRLIVPKARHDGTLLSDGDAVEIVTFVGGG
jgi:sulfur carrier protein